jgi:hypothetical protein
MHDEPSQITPQQETDLVENLVLQMMLDDHTPGLWTSDELAKAHGDPIATADALAGLHAMGLVHRHREFVWPSRAATRAAQIQNAV